MIHRVTVSNVFEITGAPSDQAALQFALQCVSVGSAAQAAGHWKRLEYKIESLTVEQLAQEEAAKRAGIISLDRGLRG